MCGILGAISRRSGSPFFDETALTSLAHRGPDGQGLYHDNHATLGHRRLAIIDLTDQAAQPMCSVDDRYVLTFNEEIYNYIEIREFLAQHGHQFRTQSDTEVLLIAFQHWGKGCLERLRGMFAFAIWDKVEQSLFFARDRCGEKPLTYYLDDDVLIFGSEFKAIVPLFPQFPDLEPEVVDMYLHYQYVPEPYTLLKGVKKLGVGHFAEFSIKNWTLNIQKYWDLTYISADSSLTEQDLRDEIETAVQMTLRSDVPVAVALSGGIDSGLIAALATRHYPEAMHAFSVGYPGRPVYDERSRAKALADKLGCVFHEIEIPTDQFVKNFPEFVSILDEPIADIAAFGHYSVPQAAAAHGVKVLLTGIGGDELFWGYDWTRLAVELNQNRSFYDLSARALKPFMRSSYLAKQFHRVARTRKVPEGLRHFMRKVLAVCENTTPADQLCFMALSGSPEFTSQVAVGDGLFGPAMSNVTKATAYIPTDLRGMPSCDEVPLAIQKLLFDTWLVSNCINLGDRVSMAVGVEARLPLLDKVLIEKVTAWRRVNPDHQLGQKTILRKILSDILPSDILKRPKSGFVPPVMPWLKGVVERYGSYLSHGNLVSQDIIREDAINKLCLFEQDNVTAHTVYRLIMLETWYERMRQLARHTHPSFV